ncbi:type III pantothenate kinase [Oceanobacillus sp. Castelsardo]|uniref:type III pantothenate kinase n=1 Tax=Oceanobacillus sp. Castelsardo TaxID=1851204 RepID=UPI0008390B58|nr:type III pantothenate kinase [Oceanobacillus sp. Castelsardo]
MLFVIDVGNTNTVLGVFEDDTLQYEWRIKTDRYKTEDEFGMLIHSLFEFNNLKFTEIDSIIISSVVPPIMFSLEKMSRDYFKIEPYIIGKETFSTYLKMNYPNPKEIGADRVVNAVAAIKEYGGPLIVVDFGTATTYCYINEKEEYCGGIIAPGMNISMEALYTKASKLPRVEIDSPGKVLGTTTIEAMKSGIYFGTIGMVDGIVNRMKDELNTSPKVIATGGLSQLIAKDSNTIDKVNPHLTLKGLYIIYKEIVKENHN